ncbi:MAG: RNase adapter RapZ [Ruminococcus sp.]|uniref:RNase adapter RapZ n=1 Tax=Ruminococcus sp. TaxID=41978 RepID=UPI001B4AC3E9|nr:RNase adapter RapZ [Ruminococcus sp.]MBO4494181.1 RNase adapter RapZ [Ruminococcus sp.]MBP5432828.1 RNase adapter RapZ [Ruminococcus sp.]
MQILIVTGMSGSGKSSVMDVMEDIGFYCIDNIPPKLITQFVDLCRQSESDISKIAVAVDIRTGDMFAEIFRSWQELKRQPDVDVKVLFIEAAHDVILKRYKETRRKHPLSEKFNGNIHEAIDYEWSQLSQLREIADYYIETSNFTSSQLKEQVKSIFLEKNSDSLIIKVMSFGFKYGIASDADLMFDIRCLPNPFYIEELRNHTGCDSCVRDYVMGFSQSKVLFDKLTDLIDFLIPLYVQEGKSQLVIAFGCTGGKHRSITFAELMAKHLSDKEYKVQKYHRDITKDKKF